MKAIAAVLSAWALAPMAMAQRLPELKPTAQGFLILPVVLNNPIFDDLTAVLGQVDGCVQFPVAKGLGFGVGASMTWYELEEHGLPQVTAIGTTERLVFYGKVAYARYTGPRTFYELNAKLGQGSWNWKCSSCADNEKQPGFHWGLNAAYFVHASDNLAFGLTLGYEADATSFGPGVIGLDHFPGRLDTGAPYRFLTVGLGFSTRFAKSPEREW
ncbi:MAG: hypothetical protein JST66_10515 [Bacteroidetes bacterium]|nr:hypothetical protein [Bacteroidota bacterium]